MHTLRKLVLATNSHTGPGSSWPACYCSTRATKSCVSSKWCMTHPSSAALTLELTDTQWGETLIHVRTSAALSCSCCTPPPRHPANKQHTACLQRLPYTHLHCLLPGCRLHHRLPVAANFMARSPDHRQLTAPCGGRSRTTQQGGRLGSCGSLLGASGLRWPSSSLAHGPTSGAGASRAHHARWWPPPPTWCHSASQRPLVQDIR